MDKPLKDWTLQELSQFCDGRNCNENCPFCNNSDDSCLLMENNPSCWNMDDWPEYTRPEISLAHLLRAAGGVRVKLVSGQDPEVLIDYKLKTDMGRGTLPGAAFPSLPADKWVDLKDIARSKAQDD